MAEFAGEFSQGWSVQMRPPRLARRYEFASYGATRGFLDELATLSELLGCHPDLNFARTYVNVSLGMNAEEPGTMERDFAAAADAIATRHGG